MTEHSDHEAKADEVERSLDEMQERSGRLGGEIEGAGEDWERKQRDPGVPGAVGDSEEEPDEPAGDGGEELDFGRDADYQAVAAPAGQADDDDGEESGDGSEASPSDDDGAGTGDSPADRD